MALLAYPAANFFSLSVPPLSRRVSSSIAFFPPCPHRACLSLLGPTDANATAFLSLRDVRQKKRERDTGERPAHCPAVRYGARRVDDQTLSRSGSANEFFRVTCAAIAEGVTGRRFFPQMFFRRSHCRATEADGCLPTGSVRDRFFSRVFYGIRVTQSTPR